MNPRKLLRLASLRNPAALAALASATVVLLSISALEGREYLSGIEWVEPVVIDPGPAGGVPSDAVPSDAVPSDAVPSDAVVLFGGEDLSEWEGAEKWTVQDGSAVAGGGTILSKKKFGDCQVHLEWAAPEEVSGDGQQRGNSGVFLMGIYEVQILDSYENTTYFDGQAGAIYKQRPPAVNACRKPGEWQTFDIIWTAPRFDVQGGLVEPAYITVLHNGVLVQNHFKLEGDTPFNRPPRYRQHADRLPLKLQDHGNPVRFRNIWVREIGKLKSTRVAPPSVTP